jgi:hypothetical protein
MHTSSTCGINGMNEGDEVGWTTMEEGMMLGAVGFVVVWMIIGGGVCMTPVIDVMILVDAVAFFLF